MLEKHLLIPNKMQAAVVVVDWPQNHCYASAELGFIQMVVDIRAFYGSP